MPVLARVLESAGFATILITPMPYWAEKVGVPRTLGVEHPFSQTLGLPNDAAMQMAVIREALDMLVSAEAPGTIATSSSIWPLPAKASMKQWQPAEPSPIIAHMAPQLRNMLRVRRKSKKN